MQFTSDFFQFLLIACWLALPLLVSLWVMIFSLGQLVGRLESWSSFDAFYWTFVTALTVGYGDIRPTRRSSRALSITIAMFGLMFSGIFVALTVECASRAFEAHVETRIPAFLDFKTTPESR